MKTKRSLPLTFIIKQIKIQLLLGGQILFMKAAMEEYGLVQAALQIHRE